MTKIPHRNKFRRPLFGKFMEFYAKEFHWNDDDSKLHKIQKNLCLPHLKIGSSSWISQEKVCI